MSMQDLFGWAVKTVAESVATEPEHEDVAREHRPHGDRGTQVQRRNAARKCWSPPRTLDVDPESVRLAAWCSRAVYDENLPDELATYFDAHSQRARVRWNYTIDSCKQFARSGFGLEGEEHRDLRFAIVRVTARRRVAVKNESGVGGEKPQRVQRRRFLVLAFRGTKEPSNWLNNILFSQTRHENFAHEAQPLRDDVQGGARFHLGFWHAAQQIQLDELTTMLTSENGQRREVIICGHSLGGALAQVTALRYIHSIDPDTETAYPTIVTFGSPLVGNMRAAEFCHKHEIEGDILNIVREGDIVPLALASGSLHAPDAFKLAMGKVVSLIAAKNGDDETSDTVDYEPLGHMLQVGAPGGDQWLNYNSHESFGGILARSATGLLADSVAALFSSTGVVASALEKHKMSNYLALVLERLP